MDHCGRHSIHHYDSDWIHGVANGLELTLFRACAMSPAKTLPRPPVAQSTDASVPVEERHVIHGASWDFYDRLTDSLADRAPFRVAYDGKDIEIMTLGPKHERSKALLDLFIEYVSAGLDIDCEALGSTTWKRSELDRGIEAISAIVSTH